MELLESRVLLSGDPWSSQAAEPSGSSLEPPAIYLEGGAVPVVGHASNVHDEYVHYGPVTVKLGDRDTYVHQWIAAQAAAFYQAQFTGGELATYLGTIAGSP